MKRVLLVDDEIELLEVMRDFLRDRYEVATATSGPAALASVAQRRPDVIFLDVHMGGPSGLDVLREIKQTDPALPVIMVTVATEMDIVQACLKAGAFAFVPKPFDLNYVAHMASLATGE